MVRDFTTSDEEKRQAPQAAGTALPPVLQAGAIRSADDLPGVRDAALVRGIQGGMVTQALVRSRLQWLASLTMLTPPQKVAVVGAWRDLID